MCVCTCVCACVCLLNHKASVGSICKGTVQALLSRSSTHSVNRSTPCMGIKGACYLCVCMCVCVHMRVCMCVLVKSQSQCRFNLQGYCIWLGKANQALLSRSICKQVNPMYGHQKSLLNNSTCVCMCVCMCVYVCVCVHMRVCMCVLVKSQSQCRFNLQGYWIWLGKS